MKEIAPNVWHWAVRHPKIGAEVDSYFLSREGLLIDPLKPTEGIERIGELGPPTAILLTNRHHYRDSGAFREVYGVPVRCHRLGLHEFTEGEEVEPFDFGDSFGTAEALEVGALCPEETAFHVDRDAGIIALGDSVVRWDPEGPLVFVPDKYLGDDPVAVKQGLTASLGRLLDRDFEILLLAHGAPIVGRGKEALRDFLKGEPAA
jgi:hypothetical protein